jgi:biopolymer transport protein ExbD/biopolymer transport protein TolR
MAATVIGAASGGRSGRRRRAVMSEINVTPFVDVMLVLLIVFMVAAPLMTMSITVDLPNAQGAAVVKTEKAPVILTVKKSDGACSSHFDLYIDKNPIAIADLETKFTALKNAGAPANVMVNADKDVCYNGVAQVLGRLRSAGFGAALNVVPEKAGE